MVIVAETLFCPDCGGDDLWADGSIHYMTSCSSCGVQWERTEDNLASYFEPVDAVSIGRHDPTPAPYQWLVVTKDGIEISREKVYGV